MSTDVKGALRRKQRGFLLNPYRFGAGGGGGGSSGTAPTFANVLLLVNAETQGATADDFIDVSSAARTITRAGSNVKRATSAVGGGADEIQKFGTYGISHSGVASNNHWTVGAAGNFNSLHNGSNWTIDLWCDWSGDAGDMVWFDSAGGTTVNTGIILYKPASATTMLCQIYRGVSSSFVVNGSSATGYMVTTYSHYRITYDHSLGSANLKFFRGGTAFGTADKTANAPSASNSTYALRAAGLQTDGSLHFRGSLDDVRIVKDEVLPGSEVITAPWPTS